jgi:hydroxymethylpyrimidine pyrophosphatase-like HAD family hydrolase
VFDVDGTLLEPPNFRNARASGDRFSVDPVVSETLNLLFVEEAYGAKGIVESARSASMTLPAYVSSGLPVEGGLMSVDQGAQLCRTDDPRNPVKSLGMAPGVAAELVTQVAKINRTTDNPYLGLFLHEGGEQVIADHDPFVSFNDLGDVRPRRVGSLYEVARGVVTKAQIMTRDKSALADLRAALTESLSPEVVTLSHSGVDVVEAHAPEAGKGALHDLAREILDVPSYAPSLVVDDSDSGIRTVANATVGVAMGNGSRRLKEVANLETLPWSEHGAAVAALYARREPARMTEAARQLACALGMLPAARRNGDRGILV